MYPSKAGEYYQQPPPPGTAAPYYPQPPPPGTAAPYYPQPPPPGAEAPVTTGFPVNSTNQFYPSSGGGGRAALETQSQEIVPWSTGLCGCADDLGNCIMTCICPCVTFGQVAEIVDRGSSSCGASGALYFLIAFVTACPCIYSCFYRSKMRGQYSLQEAPCSDCLIHCCCEPLALCQMYRELKSRGFDMSIGWHGNMEKLGRGAMTPPGFQGGMSR